MTQEETAKIILKIHGAYFSQDRFMTSTDFESRVTLWDTFFKGFSYKVVDQALGEWIKENKTIPQVSDLFQRCKDLRDLENYPKDDPMNWKSHAEQITIARMGDPDTWPEPDWLPELREKFLSAMREEAIKKSGSLPYEI